mmetsp:Transcript_11542/g.39415  ORF Transcript_11542/g.39415 Transcript_11542/m.39415 type:complete len:361 (+) Transcript_11542:1701-2783(+)
MGRGDAELARGHDVLAGDLETGHVRGRGGPDHGERRLGDAAARERGAAEHAEQGREGPPRGKVGGGAHVAHREVDGARVDRVDEDAAVAEALGELVGREDVAELGLAVGALLVVARARGQRTKIDAGRVGVVVAVVGDEHHAGRGGGAGEAEGRGEKRREAEVAQVVVADLHLVVVVRHLKRADGHLGRVDEEVEGLVAKGAGKGADRFEVGKVEGRELHGPAAGILALALVARVRAEDVTDAVHRRAAVALRRRRDDHARALLGEGQRHLEPNALLPPRDDGGLAAERGHRLEAERGLDEVLLGKQADDREQREHDADDEDRADDGVGRERDGGAEGAHPEARGLRGRRGQLLSVPHGE